MERPATSQNRWKTPEPNRIHKLLKHTKSATAVTSALRATWPTRCSVGCKMCASTAGECEEMGLPACYKLLEWSSKLLSQKYLNEKKLNGVLEGPQ